MYKTSIHVIPCYSINLYIQRFSEYIYYAKHIK